jgi:putative resolvase
VRVFRDRASGLREHHPGLDRLLAHAGVISVVRVTHEDRLARFGSAWLRQLLEKDGVLVEVAHPKGSGGGVEELVEDFTALVATFAGRYVRDPLEEGPEAAPGSSSAEGFGR